MDLSVFWKLWDLLADILSKAWQFVYTLWKYTFGKIVEMYSLPFWSLPLLEQLLYIVVLVAIIVTLFRSGRRLWSAFWSTLQAVFELIKTIFFECKPFLFALVLAVGAAWAITEFNIDPGLPNLQSLWKMMRS